MRIINVIATIVSQMYLFGRRKNIGIRSKTTCINIVPMLFVASNRFLWKKQIFTLNGNVRSHDAEQKAKNILTYL